jgi:hypothetical protein
VFQRFQTEMADDYLHSFARTKALGQQLREKD